MACQVTKQPLKIPETGWAPANDPRKCGELCLGLRQLFNFTAQLQPSIFCVFGYQMGTDVFDNVQSLLVANGH